MMKTAAYVLVNVEPGSGSRVRQEIMQRESVSFIGLVTGPYDLIVGVSVADNEALGSLVSDIRKIDGVIETLTSVVVGWEAGPDRITPQGDVIGPP
jgi:DNA-binding Lrp family transcriptional regulator